MEDLTVIIPSFLLEFTLPWTEVEHLTIEALTQLVQLRIFQRRIHPTTWPGLTLNIPGCETPSGDTLVNSVLRPGYFITMITQDQTGEVPPVDTTVQTQQLPPLLRDLGLIAMQPLERVHRRYESLIAGEPAPRYSYYDPEDGDEETAVPMLSAIRAFNSLLGMRNFPDAETVPVTSGGIKTVLNRETFERVCNIVSKEEIERLTTPAPEALLEEENDVVGGSSDAGLGACAVCLSLLVNRAYPADELRKMPNCSHIFHGACLAQWLTSNAITCPVCRQPAVTQPSDYGYLGFGSADDVYTPATQTEQRGVGLPTPGWMPQLERLPARGAVARRVA